VALADLQAVAARARAAIERADWRAARRDLEIIVGAGRAGAEVHALLGLACVRLGDRRAAHAAADGALTLEPRHLRANLLKADLLDAEGAPKEANVYYRGVVDIAASATSLPPDLADGVRRARAWRARLIQQMSEHVAADLEEAGYVAGRSDPRFTQAIDIAMGKRRYYPPQPRNFFYPGLPTVQFFPREQLPWFEALEAATDAITEELEALLAEQTSFAPYLRTNPKVPNLPD
jgi:tetratricopeptide (TPR) repeat protein